MNLQGRWNRSRTALQASSPWRHAHRSVAAHFEKKHRLKRLQPSRTKQDAYPIHYTAIRCCPPRTASTMRSISAAFWCRLTTIRPSPCTPSARAIQFIGKIERRDDRHAKRVRARQFVGRLPHLDVEVCRQFRDVGLIQIALHGVSLAVNLDGDDTRGHGRVRDSACRCGK